MDQTARAQRPLTSFTDLFLYLIIMAALASSSNLLTKQPLEGLRRGGGFSLDVPRKNREKIVAGQAECREDGALSLLAMRGLRRPQTIL